MVRNDGLWKVLSYEYDAEGQEFLIQSRELVATTSANSDNQFGDELALRDVDFYFAWVDFASPLSLGLTTLLGDFNGDGVANFADLSPAVLALQDAAQFAIDFPNVDRIAACDASGNGVCDFGDLSGLAAVYTAGPGSGSQVVPEPSACALAGVMVMLLSLFRRRS